MEYHHSSYETCRSYETRQIFDFDHKTPVYTKSESEINFIQWKKGNT